MESSLISGALYWPDTCAMELRFAGGRRYLYLGVPKEVADAFAQARSKGAFFNRTIKGQFDCHPLKDERSPPASRRRGSPLDRALRRSLQEQSRPAND